MKRREWKIKSVTERSEKWQLEQLNRYKAGVLAITSGEETKEDSIRRLYALHVPVTRKTKPAPKVPKDPKPDKKGVPAKNG